MSTSSNYMEQTLPYKMNNLPEFVLRKAEVELRETPETKTKSLKKIKDYISGDKETQNISFEEDFLVMFLRHSKYNEEKAFHFIRNFIRLRRNYSHLFTSISDYGLTQHPSGKFATVLPRRCPDGCTLYLCHIGKFHPAGGEFTIDDFKRMVLALTIIPLRDPMTQINGFKIIHDFEGTSASYLRYCTPNNLYFQYHAALKCIPGRYKEIHFVNQSILLNSIWLISKNFLSNKMKNRVYFHSKQEDLQNHFPPSVLPTKYGGTLTWDEYYQGDEMIAINDQYGSYPDGGFPNYY